MKYPSRNFILQDAEESPSLGDGNLKKAPERQRIIKTGKRGRLRKQFHYRRKGTVHSNTETAYLSEILMKKALSSTGADEWRAAMIEELTSVIRNDIWILVDRLHESIVIEHQMVFRNKVNTDRSIQHWKARLITQWFSLQPGVRFNKMFAPMTRLGSTRLMVSWRPVSNWKFIS